MVSCSMIGDDCCDGFMLRLVTQQFCDQHAARLCIACCCCGLFVLGALGVLRAHDKRQYSSVRGGCEFVSKPW
jgi:hypothetical protein